MKGKDTRGYPYRGYPPAAGCNWPRVDFDEGGKSGVPGEKPSESDWDRSKLSRWTTRGQGPVSRKSRNFTGHFRVSQFRLYLKNGEDLSRQTSQSFFFLSPWKQVKRSAFQNKRLAVSQMAFRTRKVFGTFEKRASGLNPGHRGGRRGWKPLNNPDSPSYWFLIFVHCSIVTSV